MNHEKIMQVTDFQRARLLQLEEGLVNINNVERLMEATGQQVVFMGSEDHEEQIDKEIIKGAKGALCGVVNELIFDYIPDTQTGKSVRVKNEAMAKVTAEIIRIANEIKNP